MKKPLVTLILVGVSFLAGYYLRDRLKLSDNIPISLTDRQKSKPLEKYTIENLAKTEIKPGKLEIKEILKEETEYSSYLFEFEFNPNLDGKTLKQVTGQETHQGFSPNEDLLPLRRTFWGMEVPMKKLQTSLKPSSKLMLLS